MPTSPEEEEQRLNAVAHLQLLDAPEEERFRRITRLVRRHFHVSACSITLVDRQRQFSISQQGLPGREAPLSESVCALVVEDRAPLVISNLSENRRTQDFRTLIDQLKLLFYAGVPLWSPEGWPLGTLCVFDHVPRRFSEADLESLADFAAIVESEIAMQGADRTNQNLINQLERLRMRAFVDALTGVWNRGALFDLLNRELDRAKRSDSALSVAMLDIDFFKKVNDTYGHLVGDLVLQQLCERIRKTIRAYDALGRYGGEEFVIVFPETTAEHAVSQAERVRKAIEAAPFPAGDEVLNITISIGLATRTNHDTVEAILDRADKAMYGAKRTGRNKVVSSS